MSVRSIFCSVQDIGRHVKKTKRHYVWKFSISGKEHIIELFNSTISGKKKIRVDGRIVYDCQKMLESSFNYSVDMGTTSMNICQFGDKFDLHINNQPFSQFYGGKGSGVDENRPQRRPKYDNNYSDNYEGRDQTYGEPSNSWNDVKKAAAIMREKNMYQERSSRRNGYENEDLGYSKRSSKNDAFDSYENKFSNQKSTIGKSRTNGSNGENFQDYENLPKPAKIIDNFSDFKKFDKENNDFAVSKIVTQRTALGQVNPNLFVEQVVLDDGLTTTNQQNMFAFGSEKETTYNQTYQQPAETTTKITNDLIDFATANDTTYSVNTIAPANVVLKNLYNIYPQEAQEQAQPEPVKEIDLLEPLPPKKDLWNSELVNLKEIEGRDTFQNNGPNRNTFVPPPVNMNMNMNNMNNMGMNNGYNNMQGGMGYNPNMNMGMGMMSQNMNQNMNMNMMNFGQNTNMNYAVVPYGGLGNNMQMF